MTDQPSNSLDDPDYFGPYPYRVDEHHPSDRPRSIPADFIWDEEEQAWYPPGKPAGPFDYEKEIREIQEIRARMRPEDRGRTITRDELIAAGCFKKSAGKRKSLSVKREQLPLFGDDDEVGEQAE